MLLKPPITTSVKASRMMKLDPRVERLLLSLEAEHHVTVPIERDNGELGFSADTDFNITRRGDQPKAACAFTPRWMLMTSALLRR